MKRRDFMGRLAMVVSALVAPMKRSHFGITGVPRILIPVFFDVKDPPGGTRGLRYFNPAGELAMLHGQEEVLTCEQGRGVADRVAKALTQRRTL